MVAVLDVSSDESWKKVTDEVIAKFGKIDILVNNAGISTEKGINDTTLADWQLMLEHQWIWTIPWNETTLFLTWLKKVKAQL